MKRIVFIVLGTLCVGLGGIGVVVPGLPTTPFLLLASWLFYHSSPRMRAWLLSSWLGRYIRNYEKNKGLSVRGKVMAIGMMVSMSSLSIFFFLEASLPRLIVAIACLIGVVCVSCIVPTAQEKNDLEEDLGQPNSTQDEAIQG
ncbi:MAG: YbaN family protein [Paludibacteraceae bacterium]|nr:YbaN family protein [Paludibacteraceae bacterium]